MVRIDSGSLERFRVLEQDFWNVPQYLCNRHAVGFCRGMLYISAAYVVMRYLPVCPSICPAVSYIVYCIK